ncbi:MAG: hypothetical protein N3E47_06315, partial [Candidatus Bathyarchaeota archaeon]|nr:hypothetical protein [Candidatus Bathyarchaeota archaeon]
RLRLSHAREWLKDENLSENLVERLKSIGNWLSEIASNFNISIPLIRLCAGRRWCRILGCRGAVKPNRPQR